MQNNRLERYLQVKTATPKTTAKTANINNLLSVMQMIQSQNRDRSPFFDPGAGLEEMRAYEASTRGLFDSRMNKERFDFERDRDAFSRGMAQAAHQANVDKNQMAREKLMFEQARDNFGSTVRRNVYDGIGSLAASPFEGLGTGIEAAVASPFTAIAKGVESVVSAPATTYGYRLNKMMNSGLEGLGNRIQAPDIAAKRFVETSAANMADAATGLMADIASKAVSSLTDAMVDSPARRAILETLRKEDPIIAQMGQQELMDAFHSISKFAPTLAKDKNAVRSALRMAAQSEGGLSYHTIKGLADAELSIKKVTNPGAKY